MFKFYLKGIEITESPDGWAGFSILGKIDKEQKGLYKITETTLTFSGDGYDVIKDSYDTLGFTDKITFDVKIMLKDEQVYMPIFSGYIYLKDVVFIEGNEGESAKTPIKDSALFSLIFNNKELKARPYVPRSKNDETITAATYYQVKFFSVTSTAYITPAVTARSNTAFKVFEVLRFFIDFMTDGQVDFISGIFDTGGEYENYLITNGYIARFAGTAGVTQGLFEEKWPEISFSDVYKELDKEFNLGFKIGLTGSRPYFQVEKFEDLYSTSIGYRFTDVDTVEIKTAQEFCYDRLLIGSTEILDEPTIVDFPEPVDLLGFKEEEYPILGDSNISRPLEIVNEWIISSNVIQDLVDNGQTTAPTTYDNTIILIECDAPTLLVYPAHQTNWLDSSGYLYYNEDLNNERKLNRHLGSMPNSIVRYFEADANRFRASNTAQLILGGALLIYNPVPFNDDSTGSNFDTGSNYNPTATNYYFAPPNQDAISFAAHIIVTVYVAGTVTINVMRWDASHTGLQGGMILYTAVLPVGVHVIDCSSTGYVYVGEHIVCTVTFSVSGGAMLEIGSYWECTNAGSGGVFAAFDPDNYKAQRIKFDTPMSYDNYLSMQTNITKVAKVTTRTNKSHFGWIEEYRYNPHENTCSVILIAKKVMRITN